MYSTICAQYHNYYGRISDENLVWSILLGLVDHAIGYCELRYICLIVFFPFLDFNLNNITDYILAINQVTFIIACSSNTNSQTKHDQQGIGSVLVLLTATVLLNIGAILSGNLYIIPDLSVYTNTIKYITRLLLLRMHTTNRIYQSRIYSEF